MPSNLPSFTIRISLELLKKLKVIANRNSRSANREVEMLIKKHVEQYEKSYGEIDTSDQ